MDRLLAEREVLAAAGEGQLTVAAGKVMLDQVDAGDAAERGADDRGHPVGADDHVGRHGLEAAVRAAQGEPAVGEVDVHGDRVGLQRHAGVGDGAIEQDRGQGVARDRPGPMLAFAIRLEHHAPRARMERAAEHRHRGFAHGVAHAEPVEAPPSRAARSTG